MKNTLPLVVYVVTSGSYSDYRICGIFSEMKLARDFVDQTGMVSFPEVGSIEKWVLDERSKERTMPVWVATIELESGSVTCDSPQMELIDPSGPVRIQTFGNPPKYPLSLSVWSHESREHALKLAAEKRQEWLRTKGHTETAD